MKTDSMLVAMFYALGPKHLSNFGLKYEKKKYCSYNIQFLDVKFIPYHVVFTLLYLCIMLYLSCCLLPFFFFFFLSSKFTKEFT